MDEVFYELSDYREMLISYILTCSKYLNVSACLSELDISYSTFKNAKRVNFSIMSDSMLERVAVGFSDIASTLDLFNVSDNLVNDARKFISRD